MNIRDLEKIAFEKEAKFDQTGRIFWDPIRFAGHVVGKGIEGAGRAAYNVGKQAVKWPLKGAHAVGKASGIYNVPGKAAAMYAKDPISTVAKIGVGALTIPAALEMRGYGRYRDKLDNPVYARREDARFGRPMDFLSMVKQSEYKMNNISYLEKEAGLSGSIKKGIDGFGKKIKDTPYFLPLLAGGLGLTGFGAAMTRPIAERVGNRLHDKIFSQDERLGLADERKKAMAKAYDTYLSDKMIGDLKAKDSQAKKPDVLSLVSSLSKKDPILMQASRDPRASEIMNQTAESLHSFAPSLAKNERAMQSILTEAVTSPDGGLSFQTIRNLAETQKFIDQGS